MNAINYVDTGSLFTTNDNHPVSTGTSFICALKFHNFHQGDDVMKTCHPKWIIIITPCCLSGRNKSVLDIICPHLIKADIY